jgi:hypothetical protein
LTVTYNWSYSGTGVTINGTTHSVNLDFNTSATSGTLSVTTTNGCGTSSALDLAITVNLLPVVTITGPAESCEESTVTLDAGAGFASYAWSFGAVSLGNSQTQDVTLQSLIAPTNSVIETYNVVVTNADGCTGSDNFDLIVNRLPDTGPAYHVPNMP